MNAAERGRRVRVGAYAVVLRADQLLLSRFVGGIVAGAERVWALPGGGLDHGEDPVDAVVRELAEETGYLCEVDDLLGVASTTYTRHRAEVHGVRVVYSAHVVDGELRHEVNGSTDRAAWFPLAEVGELRRFELVDQALALYRTRPRTGRAPVDNSSE